MRVLPKQYYLQLETVLDADGSEFLVRFTDDLKSVLRTWKSTTRISPVWKLRHELTSIKSDGNKDNELLEILFLSATNPSWLIQNISIEALQSVGGDDLWLTLGAHNLVLLCYSQDLIDEVTSLCVNVGKSIVRWCVEGSIDECLRIERIIAINPTEFSVENLLEKKPSAALAFEKAEMPADDTLSFMILEMYALTSVIETRAVAGFPEFINDVLGVQEVAARLVPNGIIEYDADHRITDQKKRDLLISLNAGLSRLASQALSGTTPITQTECHFWPHSFLGTGVANYALRNITQFLTDAVLRFNYHDRYEYNLKRAFFYPITSVDEKATFHANYLNLTNKYVFEMNLLEQEAPKSDTPEKGLDLIPNPITYFSGRDGFKNTLLTTSAPLMSISGANCVRWNLGTISHEISHRIISGKLERLLKSVRHRVGQVKDFNELKTFLKVEPKTTEEYAENLLVIFLANKVFETSYGAREEEIKTNFGERLTFMSRQASRDIEEILVHMFDFLHFYGGDASSYVEFVWHSWAVQPSIIDKIDDYVLRTTLALASARFEHSDFLSRALGDFERIFGTASFKEKLLPLVSVLEKRLASDPYRKNLLTQADRCSFLIRLFHAIFRSDELIEYCAQDSYSNPVVRSERIGKELLAEDDVNSGDGVVDELDKQTADDLALFDTTHDKTNDFQIPEPQRKYKQVLYKYNVRKRQFHDYKSSLAEGQFANPLMFLRDFSRDEEPEAARSAWLLTLLAFNWLKTDRTGGTG